MSDFIPNRESAGKSTGGQFAPKTNSESNIDLPSDEAAGVDTFNDVTDALTHDAKPIQLTYTEYDDKLTEEQIDAALKGDWDEVEMSIDKHFGDHRAAEAAEIAEQEINYLHSEGRFRAEWDDLDDDEQTDARFAVERRDTSDIAGQLMRTTPEQDLRVSAGTSSDFLSDNPSENVKAAIASFPEGVSVEDVVYNDPDSKYNNERVALVEAKLKDHGLDTDQEGVRESVKQLVEGGYYDWNDNTKIDVVWSGRVDEVTPNTRDNQHEAEGRAVEIRNPQIIMHKGDMETAPSEVTIPGSFRKTITKQDHAVVHHNPYGRSYSGSSVNTEGWVKEDGSVVEA